MDLLTVNEGDTPTFARGTHRSFIDVTCFTRVTTMEVRNWSVLEDEENFSDHHNICWDVALGQIDPHPLQYPLLRWKGSTLSKDRLTETFRNCDYYSA